MGVGEAAHNSKALDSAVADLTIIAGQKPVLTRAKKISCCMEITCRNAYWR